MNNKKLYQTFIDLVTIDSPSGYENEIALYIEQFLNTLKIDNKRDTYGNVIAKLVGQGKPLLLSAHMDTVEPGRGIEPIIDNGRIKSKSNTILGADNKAALAAILDTIAICVEKKITHRPLELVFTRSEEVANLGAVELDYALLNAKDGYCFDNENPVGTIISSSPFYNRFTITLIGKAAHASLPENANNVLPMFVQAFSSLPNGRISPRTMANIGKIAAGHVRNTIPGEMIIEGEIRSSNEQELEEILEKIEKTFLHNTHKFAGEIHFETVRENGGYEYSAQDKLIKRTEKIMRQVNMSPVLKQAWGVSDANIFTEHGIKVINLADGTQNAHTTEETISLDSLKMLSDLILSLLSTIE